MKRSVSILILLALFGLAIVFSLRASAAEAAPEHPNSGSVRESYWKEGLGFGALAGAAGGAVAGLTLSLSCDESSDCRIAAWTAPLAIGIPLGTLIGWGIGLATDKRQAVRIFPNFSSSNGETRAGVGAGLEF